MIHTAQEPAIEGRTIRADHGTGRMFCRTLLPEEAILTPIGGPGNEFRTGQKNWSIEAGKLKPEQRAMMGQWRVEVTPGVPRKEDVFLHVIQVGPQTVDAMDAADLIQTEDRCGVRLSAGGDVWEISWNTSGPLGGRIKRTGERPTIERELTSTFQAQSGIIPTSRRIP
jgi:heparin/heparan-sulfate lyase